MEQAPITTICTQFGSSEELLKAFRPSRFDLLPPLEGQPFFCPHKSYCVNLAFVRGIHVEYQCYEMVDGKKVPISRSNRSKAKRAMELA